MPPFIQKYQKRLLLASLALSGSAAITYQILWIRRLQFAFGGTNKATAAGLAIFMAGLGLGSWLYSRRRATNPLRDYAWLEIGLGLTALLADKILDVLPSLVATNALAWIWPLLSALALAGPACLSGATLPAATSALDEGAGPSKPFGQAYFLNLGGAALGSLCVGLLLLPNVGLRDALLFAAACNIIPGLFLLWPASSQQKNSDLGSKDASSPFHLDTLLAASFLSGSYFFILEHLWTHSLALSLGASSPALALMLFSVLTGLFLGAWYFNHVFDRTHDWRKVTGWGFLALVPTILFQAWLLGRLPRFHFMLLKYLPEAITAQQFILGTAAFLSTLLVTLPQGFLFPALLAAHKRADPTALQVGRLLSINSAGAVLGALASAWIGLPLLGLQPLFAVAAGLALLAAVILFWDTWTSLKRRAALACLILLLLLSPSFKPWDPRLISAGIAHYGMGLARSLGPTGDLDTYLASFNLLSYQEDPEGVVSVMERGTERALAVNGKQESATRADLVTQKLLAHLGLGLRPTAETALVIGWGSGGTTGAASLHPLKQLRCVELCPAVFESARYFTRQQQGALDKPFVEIGLDDARHDLVSRTNIYDVIISAPSNPWIHGVANLFSTDFYALAQLRLRPGGVVAQWFQLYDMDEETLRLQLRTFASSFKDVSVWLAPPSSPGLVPSDLILIGSSTLVAADPQALAPLFGRLAATGDLASIQITSPADLIACRLLQDADLRRYAGQGPLNTDRRPRLEYAAAKARRGARRDAFRQRTPGAERRDLINRMDSFAPSSAPKLSTGAEWVAYAETNRRLGLLTRAISGAKLALAQQPGNANAHLVLGRTLQDAGNVSEARIELKKSLKLSKKNGQTYVSLGSLEMDSGNFEEAAKIFATMRREFPSTPDALFGEASAWLAAKRRDKAEPLVREFKLRFGYLKQSEILEKGLNK